MTTQTRLGATIGRAMARDVLAENMPRDWTGLDAQDGDELTAAGIMPDTAEWVEAEAAARVAYDAEHRAVRVEELARRLWDQDVLCCDSMLVSDLLQRNDVDGFDYCEDVENLYPDPSNWTPSECREWLDDHQHDTPDDDNPFNLDRDDLVEALENLGHAVFDNEDNSTLAEALFSSLDAGDWGDIDTWQDAVRDSDPEPAEVFEWWRVSPMLCDQLRDIGRVVLDNDYGYWWGRTCTGQGLLMDGVLQEVAAAMLER